MATPERLTAVPSCCARFSPTRTRTLGSARLVLSASPSPAPPPLARSYRTGGEEGAQGDWVNSERSRGWNRVPGSNSTALSIPSPRSSQIDKSNGNRVKRIRTMEYRATAKKEKCSPCTNRGPLLRYHRWESEGTKRTALIAATVCVKEREWGRGCLPVCVHSVQFSRSFVSDSLRPHGLQHARLPCPSPTPGAYSNSCALSR